MNLRYIRGSVAYALLTVVLLSAVLGHTIPESSVNTTTESPVEIDEKPIERPVVIGEDLVAGVPAIVATCNNPLIREDCIVYMASYGLEDKPRFYGYVVTSGGSSEQILAAEAVTNRGVTLLELDPTTCVTRNRQRFDTFGYADERTQMLETLESATTGTIIIGVTADSAEHDFNELQTAAGPFFTRYNMYLRGMQVREKFIFIMQKGYPKKTLFQRKVRNSESQFMNVRLSGYTVSDVTFRQA